MEFTSFLKPLKLSTYTQSINYIAIKSSYAENTIENRKSTNDINKFVKLISNGYEKNESSIYEVIPDDKPIKFYLDIKNISETDITLLNGIIFNLRSYFKYITGQNLGNCITTRNINSINHPGLNFHVIFYKYKTYKKNISIFIENFIKQYPNYTKYINTFVYDKNQLFRCVDQVGISSQYKSMEEKMKDKYQLYNNTHINKDISDSNSEPVFSEDIIKHSLVQYTDMSINLDYTFKIDHLNSKDETDSSEELTDLSEDLSNSKVNSKRDFKGNSLKSKIHHKTEKHSTNMIESEIYSLAFVLCTMKDKLTSSQCEYVETILENYAKYGEIIYYSQTEYEIKRILELIYDKI